MQDELLALLIEEVSITASGMTRKKPISIPRPSQDPSATATPTARKHGGLYEAALMRGGRSG